MKVSLFDTVHLIEENEDMPFGKMKVVQILSDEEADFYGSYPVLCRLEDGFVVDFREAELEVVENA